MQKRNKKLAFKQKIMVLFIAIFVDSLFVRTYNKYKIMKKCNSNSLCVFGTTN